MAGKDMRMTVPDLLGDGRGRDPRETAGLCKAIPKRNLAMTLKARGIKRQDLDAAMGVPRGCVSRWCTDNPRALRRMTDAEVVLASWLLGVHPLYLLDMREDPNIMTRVDVVKETGKDILHGIFSPTYLAEARRSMAVAVASLDPYGMRWWQSDAFTYTDPETDEETDVKATSLTWVYGFSNTFSLRVVSETACDVSDEDAETYDHDLESVRETAEYYGIEFGTDEDYKGRETPFYDVARESLVGLHGDYRDPRAVGRAMLDLVMRTASDGKVDEVLDVLAMEEVGHTTPGKKRGHWTYDGATYTAEAGKRGHQHDTTREALDALAIRARFLPTTQSDAARPKRKRKR